MKDNEIVEKIIGIFYKVYNALGHGFLEKVYENAMVIELKLAGIKFEQQSQVKIYYNGELVGNYVSDLIIEDRIIVELKAISNMTKFDEAQLLNYLKATRKKRGLLLNYGKKAVFKKMIF